MGATFLKGMSLPERSFRKPIGYWIIPSLNFVSRDRGRTSSDSQCSARPGNHEFACYRAALAASGKESVTTPAFLAGHSLGEYTALVLAGVLDFSTAVYLAHERGA